MEPITKDELKKLKFKEDVKNLSATIIDNVIDIAKTGLYNGKSDLRNEFYRYSSNTSQKDIDQQKYYESIRPEFMKEHIIKHLLFINTRLEAFHEMKKARNYFHHCDNEELCQEVMKVLRVKFPDSLVEYREVQFSENVITRGIYVDWS